jgi:flagellar hook-length control protein FliK
VKPRPTHSTGADKQREQKKPARPKRTKERGPIGFSQVMKAASKGAKPAKPAGEPPAAAATPQQPGGAGAGFNMPVGSAAATREDKKRETAIDLAGISTAVQTTEHSTQHHQPVLETAATHQAEQPRHLGNLTPQQAMHAILDEARKLEIEQANRELHIELEPAHLGPLVVRLMVDRGRIRTELSAREETAAAALSTGIEGLRERLEGLGYASAEVEVQHDADLVLGVGQG